MEIRLATQADEEVVCRLWTMLLDFYNKQAAPDVLQCSFRYVIGQPEKVLVFIILNEGVVTGTASLHLGRFSTWYNFWYGHIEDVIVDPAHRGHGYAHALLSHIVTVAQEKNLGRLELGALNDNLPARKMYEKIGFKTDSCAYELVF